MTTTHMRVGSVVLDCADAGELASFYSRLLGWPDPRVDEDGSWADLANPEGGIGLSFQRAIVYRPPSWPDPDVPQQIHMDIQVDDLEAGQAHALEVGARLVDDQGMKATGFRVYTDPAGHPFCLFTD